MKETKAKEANEEEEEEQKKDKQTCRVVAEERNDTSKRSNGAIFGKHEQI